MKNLLKELYSAFSASYQSSLSGQVPCDILQSHLIGCSNTTGTTKILSPTRHTMKNDFIQRPYPFVMHTISRYLLPALFIFAISFTEKVHAQSMGISTTTITPDASSILEIRSTAKGLLIPRMTQAQRDAINSGTFASGLIVYNTDTKYFNYYDGTTWQVLSSGSSVVNSITGTTDKITIGGTATNPTVTIAATYLGQTSITTLGTITTGVWNGTALTSAYLPAAVVYNNQANSYTAGMKQTFQSSSTTAGLNFAGVASDPSTLANGDLWHNTTLNALKYRSNGTTRILANLDESQIFTNKDFSSGTNTFPTFNQSTTGTASKATNLVGGNSTTLLGSIPYQSNTDVTTMLSPNTTSTKKFLTQTGSGTNGAAPAWSTIAASDVPTLNQNTTGNAATVTTNANLTGDVTSVGNATILATVNSNIGTFNSVTVNAKGLVTAASITTTQITTPLNSTPNTGYTDNATYYGYGTVANGFPVSGSFSGVRFGTVGTQRIQSEANGQTYARAWLNGSSAWSAWSLYLDAQDYTAKGQIHVSSASNTNGVLSAGTDGYVLTADAASALGVKWGATTGTGNVVLATSPTLITPILGVASSTSHTITGTGGAGFVELQTQSSNPATGPTNSIRLFSNATGQFSWIKANDGFSRSFTAVLTANRVYTLPDATGTIPVSASGNIALSTAGNISFTGTLPIANGGTNSTTTLNNNRMMMSSGGAIVESTALTNGQLHIGSTGAVPVAANLTAGNGITITNGAGSITVSKSFATLASDQLVTTNLMADVTGLSFPVAANTTYRFHAVIYYSTTSTGKGIIFAVNGPASPAYIAVSCHIPISTTTESVTFNTGYDLPSTAVVSSSLAGGNLSVLDGFITTGSTAGTVVIRERAEAANVITIRAGSSVEFY